MTQNQKAQESYITALFDRYIQNNGPVKSEGYIEALKDITIQIHDIIYPTSGGAVTNTPNNIATKLKSFLSEKKNLIKYASEKSEMSKALDGPKTNV